MEPLESSDIKKIGGGRLAYKEKRETDNEARSAAEQKMLSLQLARNGCKERFWAWIWFLLDFFNVCFLLPLFWGSLMLFGNPRVCPVPRGSIWNSPWTNSRGRNLMREGMGKVCTCVCVLDYEKVCLYVFLCITPVHARIYTPVCSLYTCVCVELVKECTFDWVQTAHKSGL